MHLPKLKLEFKLLIAFAILSILPLLITNYIWFTTSRDQVIKDTSVEVRSVAKKTAGDIASFLTTKIISLIIHSQTEGVLKKNLPVVSTELQNFLSQDQDIEELTLIGSDGKELLRVSRHSVLTDKELPYASSSAAFKITTFVGGSKYISPVSWDKNGNPYLDIAVPIVLPGRAQSLQNLSTSASGEIRKHGEILGTLVEKVSLKELWSSINAARIDRNGYVYVVDDKGIVLTHPNTNFVHIVKNVAAVEEVTTFLDENNRQDIQAHADEAEDVQESKSEKGIRSFTSHTHIPLTRWGVIAQVPLADTLAATNNIQFFFIVLLLITLAFIVILSLWLARRVVMPIRELQEGSRYIGEGNLQFRLNVHTNDELEDLSNAFNLMAHNLEDAFQKLKEDKSILSAERDKIAITLSSIADAVIAVDMERRIIIFNKAAEALTGFASPEVLGKKLYEVFSLFDDGKEITYQTYCPIRFDMFEGISFTKTNLRLTTSRREVYIDLVAGHIREGQSANLGCILTLHDKTQEKELEEMKLDFVSMAAHELRTPLTSIQGYLSVFMQENAHLFNGEQSLFLRRIQISTQQLMALVENLLNVTRIERGEFTVNKKPTDWTGVIRQVVDQLQGRAKEKKISLVFVAPLQPIHLVLVDELRITEVVNNLVANAVNYTNPGGSIHVWVEEKGNEIITHVRDTGHGIPKNALAHLFTKFYRVGGKLEQGSKGTGLGLYISKTIVELHGGTIWVESEEGVGSVFSFSLPSVVK